MHDTGDVTDDERNRLDPENFRDRHVAIQQRRGRRRERQDRERQAQHREHVGDTGLAVEIGDRAAQQQDQPTHRPGHGDGDAIGGADACAVEALVLHQELRDPELAHDARDREKCGRRAKRCRPGPASTVAQ